MHSVTTALRADFGQAKGLILMRFDWLKLDFSKKYGRKMAFGSGKTLKGSCLKKIFRLRRLCGRQSRKISLFDQVVSELYLLKISLI